MVRRGARPSREEKPLYGADPRPFSRQQMRVCPRERWREISLSNNKPVLSTHRGLQITAETLRWTTLRANRRHFVASSKVRVTPEWTKAFRFLFRRIKLSYSCSRLPPSTGGFGVGPWRDGSIEKPQSCSVQCSLLNFCHLGYSLCRQHRRRMRLHIRGE